MVAFRIFQKKNKNLQEEKKEIKEAEKIQEKEQEKVSTGSKTLFLSKTPFSFMPYLSEKATALKKVNQYVFEVEKDVNKNEIKKAIEKFYKVKVEKINLTISKREKKRFGRKVSRFQPKKKAIVTLKEEEKIEI